MSHTFKTIQLYALILAFLLSANIGFAQFSSKLLKSQQVHSRPNSSIWHRKLDQALPLLGHRNWIVIADSAYPHQSAPGIETIYTGSKQIEVLEEVLKRLGKVKHVSPVVMLDAELKHVPEDDAPGVEAYRKQLNQLLKGQKITEKPHEDIIGQLDADSKLYKVLLLKTDLTIPYTSVFLQLDCGYWGPEKEQRMRDAIEGVKSKKEFKSLGDRAREVEKNLGFK
ncbi:MAG: RbsD/FucU domain-containing protein [Pirellulales bacterium]